MWIGTDSTIRQAITAAAHALESRLQIDPYGCSESRGGPTRIAFLYPLGVEIEVDEAAQLVWVLHVWRFRRRGD